MFLTPSFKYLVHYKQNPEDPENHIMVEVVSIPYFSSTVLCRCFQLGGGPALGHPQSSWYIGVRNISMIGFSLEIVKDVYPKKLSNASSLMESFSSDFWMRLPVVFTSQLPD